MRRATWLGDVLRFPTQERPDALAVTLVRDRQPDQPRSFRRMWEGALAGAGGLRAAEVGAGDAVVIALPTGWEFIDAFFGAALLGAVSVPTAPPATAREAELAAWVQGLRRVAADCGAAVALVPERFAEAIGRAWPSGRVVGVGEGWSDTGPPLPVGEVVEPPDAGALAMVQYTSGTTGTPRGVRLSHGNLMANAGAIEEVLDPIADEVTVSWLPLFHDMGLHGALVTVLRAGKPLVLMTPQDFVRRPMSWLRVISDHRGTITVAPNFAFEQCVRRLDPEALDGVDLSCLRIALNGAEPVDVEGARRFQQAFSPWGLRPDVVRPVYGLAEATLAVTFSDAGPIQVDPATGRVCVGRPLPGVQVRVDAPPGEVGEIEVQGPSVCVPGWLPTGDLGYLAGGQLYVTGRSKDLIIRHGRNLYPQDLEAVACGVDGVRSGAAVAFGDGDHVQVVAESRSRDADERQAIAQSVRQRLVAQFGFAPEVRLVKVGELPRTTSGKLMRSAAAERYGPGPA